MNDRYDPLNIFNQMNKMISLRDQDVSSAATSQWAPAVDIKEDVDNYVIEADLPGVKKDAIEVSMENGTLTIKGERKEENKTEGSSYTRTERVYGSFYRKFSLPDTADAENISASFDSGVLKLRIPKKEISKPKRIDIRVGE